MASQQRAGELIARESSLLVDSATKMDNSIKSQTEFISNVMTNMEKLQQASENVNAASNEISSSSSTLAVQARELKSLVDRTNQSAQELKNLMI